MNTYLAVYPNAIMVVPPFSWTETKSDFKRESGDQVPAALVIVNGEVVSRWRDNV